MRNNEEQPCSFARLFRFNKAELSKSPKGRLKKLCDEQNKFRKN